MRVGFGLRVEGAGACGTDVRCAEGAWEERRGKGRRMRVQTGGDGAGDVLGGCGDERAQAVCAVKARTGAGDVCAARRASSAAYTLRHKPRK